MAEPQITLAAIAGAHGVAGEVRLKLFAQDLASFAAGMQFALGDRVLTLKSIRPGKQPVARFAEIGDRDAAEALRGELLTVPRAALPPLGEGEYYHADLIGLACVDADGGPLGTVFGVENFGAGDILDVALPSGKRAMVPFRPGIADLDGERIVVDSAFLA
jgi:16S rRNA processing protein RimM